MFTITNGGDMFGVVLCLLNSKLRLLDVRSKYAYS